MPDPAPASTADETHSRVEPTAFAALGLLSVVWAWWAWQYGAYFGVVVLPGTIVLCLGTALLCGIAPSRLSLRLSPPVIAAVAALIGLGAWTLLSALWSPSPDVAVADCQRVLVYALGFGLGVWLCNLLGPRLELSMVPLAAAAAFAGAAAVIALLGVDSPRELLGTDGTLEFPLGYRNANAAFFAIAAFPALGLAGARSLDWRLRGMALGAAVLCLDLVVLSQSRGSIPAIGVATVVFILLSPVRLRALSWLVLAVVPVLGVLEPASALYSAAADGGIARAPDEISAAATAVALTSLVAVAIGAAAARFERRLPGLRSRGPEANRIVGWGFWLAVALVVVAFVGAVGNPVEWAGDRFDEFRNGGTPDLSEEASRFTFNAASDRRDLWEVALDDARDDPLLGDGAGGFQYSYTRNRQVVYQDARDAHSVELEMLSELGIPGLGLFVVAIGGALWGILRARRRGPGASALAAVALASGSYWLVHSSVDWLWSYPALTAPMLALLGSACAPAVFTPDRPPSRRWRWWLVAGLGALAISAVPPFLAERYVNSAYAGWQEDLDRAYDDLGRAEDLNRLGIEAMLAEGAIAREVGDRKRAITAFRAAARRRPEEWASHYLLAELQAESDPGAARDEVRIALELNPLSQPARSLARRLGVDPNAPAASAGA